MGRSKNPEKERHVTGRDCHPSGVWNVLPISGERTNYLPPEEYWQGDPQARVEERRKKLEEARRRRETINRQRLQQAA